MKLAVLALVWHAAPLTAFQPRSQSTRRVTPSSSVVSSSSSFSLRLSSSSDNENNVPSLQGKTVYKRTLFRLQPSPDLPLHNALVIEERLRYRPSAADPTFMEPFGPRTLLLRDGQVDQEGAIGDEFCTLDVHEVPPSGSSSSSKSSTLQHGGRTGAVDESIILGLVLAAQPDVCQGPVLEIAAREGLGALVGCMGAAFATKTPEERANLAKMTDKQQEEDVLTVPTNHVTERLLPKGLTSLVITDRDPVMLDLCAAQVTSLMGASASGGSSNKVHVQALDWQTRALPMAQRTKGRREYATVVLADGPLTFPETREMVRSIAHRVGPSNPALARLLFQNDNKDDESSGSSSTFSTPRFVHISRDGREETVYMRKYLTEGCRMRVSTDYVTVEKIGFAIQSIDSVPPNEENALLDPLELEVSRLDELDYQILTAMHDPAYTGGGSGEVFFPMEATDFSVGGRGGGARGPEPERGSFLG